MTVLSHKIALNPNDAQRIHFGRAAGAARFAWNWALTEWQRQYAAGQRPSYLSILRDLNAVKRQQFPWLYDVTKSAPQEAIIDLGTAFQRFFNKKAQYPRFKTRDDRPSFCAANERGRFRVEGKRIKLPIIGWVRMRESVRFSGEMKRATVSCEAGRWFVAISIEMAETKVEKPLEGVIGIDLGIQSLAVLSSGEVIACPKPYTASLKKIRRANKSLARKKAGSANRRKAKLRLARLHSRISSIRKDTLHKLTTRLAKTYAVIGVENLNVAGMLRNRRIARSASDIGMYEFKRQIRYKAALSGARLVVADKWFPSSKTCSCCGVVKATLGLAERVFRCDDCGFEAGRDYNAALNLEKLAASSAVTACGDDRSGSTRKRRVKRLPEKQEENAAMQNAA